MSIVARDWGWGGKDELGRVQRIFAAIKILFMIPYTCLNMSLHICLNTQNAQGVNYANYGSRVIMIDNDDYVDSSVVKNGPLWWGM